MPKQQRGFNVGDAFALIVDINSFAPMVARSQGNSIAQFTRDILIGAVSHIEGSGGEVVGFMGDAILGLARSAEDTFRACVGIARDVNEQCRYISEAQREGPDSWDFCPGGPSMKIGIEYGYLDVTNISSRSLGEQNLYIGDAINYAARITQPGTGNRCHVGPNAREKGLDDYPLSKLRRTVGKPGEGIYEYFRLDLSDIWKEGKRRDGRKTYIDD